MLNLKQQLALNEMKKGKNIFLTGEAGTGKSFVINEFIKYCNESNISYMICAPTGIAAINVNGVTLHRAFKIPIKPLIESPKSIPSTLKDMDLLLIDEISMTRVDVFDYVAQCIIALNKNRRSRGVKDIQVIVVGDFFQLPPVITDKDRTVLEQYKYGDELGRGFAFQSKYWSAFGFVNIQLDEVVRQSDKSFINYLNGIRHGNVTCINYFNTHSNKQEIKDAILICGTNKAVNEKNEIEYNKIQSKEFVYKAIIRGTVAESDKVVPEVLKLKVGCRVMTVLNDLGDRYQNGTLATVTKLDNDTVTIVTDDGIEAEIYRNTWNIHDYKADKSKKKVTVTLDTIGTYNQFPLKLAYAVTVHKAQGQTFENVNLNPYCWDCGQLYVALSRVKTIEGLHLTQPIQYNFLITSGDVKNFYENM